MNPSQQPEPLVKPDNTEAVFQIAAATKLSIDHWIDLVTETKH